jgi:hypothetical protein
MMHLIADRSRGEDIDGFGVRKKMIERFVMPNGLNRK